MSTDEITRAAPAPRVVHVVAVTRDVLAVEVQAGRVQPMRQVPYEPQPGDRTEEKRDTHEALCEMRLIRDGRAIGYLVGPERNTLTLFEELIGDPLDEAAADRPESYAIDGAPPAAVCRKTKTNDWAQPWIGFAKRHYLYLRLRKPLEEGRRYTVEFPALGVNGVGYLHDPRHTRSEAVHASHVGFRPDDPGKCAFLSVWLGTGGALSYPEGLRFQLVDDETDETVHEGSVVMSWPATEPEHLKLDVNYNKTDVLRMEFGGFSRPGRYRVFVEGVGCSYPFEMAADVWQRAFAVSMKGCYHHRSGIALGPPHTDYVRPRCFHPDDGIVVYHSTCPLMYSGNGLNALGTDEDNFGNLIAGCTDEIVPDAWGAYMDAGDWDRRIQHLDASRLQLELVDMFPDFFRGVGLNIPESGNELPDTVNEALFNVDGYRRLQTDDGGVRGGIESAAHPVQGECSWQESLRVMAYAPGLWSSFVYAGVAARAAHVLRLVGSDRAEEYAESAVRAMRWAEDEYAAWPSRPEYPRVRDGARQCVHDDRCLAAVEFYRLTGDERWHEIFRQTTPLRDVDDGLNDRQRDAAFVYARLDDKAADPELKQHARDATIWDAERSLEYARGNAWGLSTDYPGRPPQMGFYTMPGAMQLIRAHFLTGRADLLEAIVRSAVFSAGGNPMNLAMTTGVGHASPQHPLHVDHRYSGVPVPSGITLYGPHDIQHYGSAHYWAWPIEAKLKDECVPSAYEWPSPEGYFDVFLWPADCEYTIMQTLGPNSYAWGYLAARP